MRFLILLPFMALLPAPASAQSAPRDRPPLPAGADVNDVAEFYRLANQLLESNPVRAEQAYAWAARLAPGSAELWYGRFVARLLARPEFLIRWMQADVRAMRQRDMMALDSLRLAFHTADPFFFGQYDGKLLMAYFDELIERDLRQSGNTSAVDRAAIDFELTNYLKRQGPEMNGWLAYTERRFANALSHYTSALKVTKDRAGLYSSRALVFYHTGRYAEAIADLKLAVEDRSKQEKDKLVHVYESQATYEFMIGRASEAMNDTASAREAYARALLSELSYYPAHLRLGRLDLAAGDTAAALNAFKTALDLRPNDPAIRYLYGDLLLSAGRPAEAEPELKQATVLEPYFAAPYYGLGRVAELQGKRADAAAWYRQFLERTSRRNELRAAAETKLRELGS
ncbi:MAG: tetratricopeptide repeat protein [Longimicrobiales bacterium]